MLFIFLITMRTAQILIITCCAIQLVLAVTSVKWWVTTLDKKKLFERQFDIIAKSTPPVTTGNILKINDSIKYQKIYGIGAALTQSSAYLFSKLKDSNETLFKKTMLDLFSSTGANINMVRIPLSACDFNLPDLPFYTYDDTPNDESLASFSLQNDMNYLIPMLKEIKKYKPNIQIVASPWSAPAWYVT